MAHGNIYGPDKVDAALANYFRPGNRAALRELALLWVADRVDEGLPRVPPTPRHRSALGDARARRSGPHRSGRQREPHPPRRRIASRTKAELVGIHVGADDGLAGSPPDLLVRPRGLLEELGGTYREVVRGEMGPALVQAARAEGDKSLTSGGRAAAEARPAGGPGSKPAPRLDPCGREVKWQHGAGVTCHPRRPDGGAYH